MYPWQIEIKARRMKAEKIQTNKRTYQEKILLSDIGKDMLEIMTGETSKGYKINKPETKQ